MTALSLIPKGLCYSDKFEYNQVDILFADCEMPPKAKPASKVTKPQQVKLAQPTAGRGRRGRGRGRGNAVLARASLRQYQPTSDIIITGSDIIASLDIPTGASPGRVFIRQTLNPRDLPGTRLSLQSQAWQLWRPLSFTFKLSGAASSVTNGQLAMVWVADPDEHLPKDPVSLLRKVGSLNNVYCKLWESRQMTLQQPPVQRMLYCDTSRPDSRHGAVIVACTASTGAYQGSVNVVLSVDWKVKFESPDLPSSEESSELIEADNSYAPYYTSGSSHLTQSDRLTCFSSNNGGYGNITRFTNPLADVVYTPVSADQLNYSFNKQKLYVKALVRMKEVPDPLMWCFASVELAEAYIKTGTITNIIKWEADGDWCKGNPLWKPVGVGEPEARPQSFIPHFHDPEIARQTRAIMKRLYEAPLGTLTDPIKVFSEDPIPGTSTDVPQELDHPVPTSLAGQQSGPSECDSIELVPTLQEQLTQAQALIAELQAKINNMQL